MVVGWGVLDNNKNPTLRLWGKRSALSISLGTEEDQCVIEKLRLRLVLRRDFPIATCIQVGLVHQPPQRVPSRAVGHSSRSCDQN